MGIITTINTSAVSAYLQLVGGVALSASLTSITDQFGNVSPLQIATASIGLGAPTFMTLANWTQTLGSKDGFYSLQSVNVASAGTGVFRMIRNSYTINNTAAQTGSVTGYFLNATETNLNGMTHNLMDLQVGGVSKFTVGKTGGLDVYANINFRGGAFYSVTTDTGINFNGTGIISLTTTGGFNRLQFGGTTNAFPSIKRQGAGLEMRLADDSGYCSFVAQSQTTLTYIRSGTYGIFGSIGAADESAILQADSTTKGALIPRMTQAQILAIANPARGLQVYNTDLETVCFYDSTAARWERFSHSIM